VIASQIARSATCCCTICDLRPAGLQNLRLLRLHLFLRLRLRLRQCCIIV
jgi:hypothetical protein